MSGLRKWEIYYGPGEERVVLLESKSKKVVVANPLHAHLSEFHREMTLGEFKKFIKGSQRRNYRSKDGESRIRIENREDSVVYLDAAGAQHEVPQKEWDKWRAKVK